MLTGCDISAYQNAIPGGQDFVILKATEGTSYVDRKFSDWWAELAGKLRGAYHFGHPGNDAVAEADHFVTEVGYRLTPGDLVVLDFETNDGLGAAHCAAWAATWLARVRTRIGLDPVVYTFLSFAWDGNCAGLGGYALWIADPSSPAGKPRVPAPWKNWALHQYSTSGGLDHDVFNGTASQWRRLGGQVAPTPTPATEDDEMYGELRDGNVVPTIITWPAGKAGAIGFGCDNGLQNMPAPKLRVAVHSHAGGWDDIRESVVVDSTKGKTVLSFVAHDVDMVSVERLDNGLAAVSWDAS